MTTTDAKEFNRLAEKVRDWSPESRNPLTFIAHERRTIESALRTAAAESGAGAVKVKPLSDAQWLKTRTAETGVVLKNSDRTRFLENVRFAERHIAALIPEPAKADDAVLRRALTGLRNEARGALSLGEDALREAISNTNVNCLLHWIEEADEALASTAQPDTAAQGGKQSDGGVERFVDSAYQIAEEMRREDRSSEPAPAEPVPDAWVIPGDTANDKGFIDAMAWEEGEFTKPLYAHPPRSVDVEAIKRAIGCIRLQWRGIDDATIDAASVDEAACSIARMIEGLPSDPIAPAAPVSVDEVLHFFDRHERTPRIDLASALLDAFKMERK